MSWSHARYCDTNQVCNTLIFLLGGLLGGEYAYQYFSVRNIGIVGADRRKMMRWYDYWCDTLWRVVVQSIIDENVSVDIIIIIIVVLAATWVVIATLTLCVVDYHHHHHHHHHHPMHLHHRQYYYHHHPMHLHHHHHHHYQVSPRISEHPRFHEMWEIFEWVSLYLK